MPIISISTDAESGTDGSVLTFGIYFLKKIYEIPLKNFLFGL